jgi:hypothetical protein
VIRMLFHCYGLDRIERAENYCVYEQCQSQCYERRLNEKDRPAQVQSLWPSPSQFMFVLRRATVEKKKLVVVPTTGLDSAGVSPVNSERDPTEAMEDIMESPVSNSSPSGFPASFQMSSPTKYFVTQRHQHLISSSPRSLPSFEHLRPKFNLNMASIHESGLPPPPALRPKPSNLVTSNLLLSNRSSLGSLSSGSRSSSASFHEYENYFYI